MMKSINILALFVLSLFLFFFSPVLAEDPTTTPPPDSPQGQRYESVEERRIMEAIKASGNNQTFNEQEDLERRKKELKRLESEVDKKIEQLNQLRIAVEKLIKQKDAVEQKRIIDLAKMYEKMPADKGANVIGNLNIDLAISILSQMKTKSAAKILSNMDREKAAKLTTAFSTLDSR
ncbi:MAG: hypothetical protein PHI97_22695 [Desulfobulbus sp.]|nr:hypothetical protein [Desulfobulbus sp.]